MQRIKITLLVIIFGAVFSAQAQFNRQQAIDTVLNHVVAADTGNIRVYIANHTFTTSDALVTYTLDTISCPFSTYYVFFIDDNPLANWQHGCRYLMLDSTSGNFGIVNKKAFPVDLEQAYDLVSDIPPHQPFDLSNNTEIVLPTANPSGDLYAVLIAGNITAGDEDKYSNDMALVYNTLLEQGYTKENIIVHYGHGEGTAIYGNDFDDDDIPDIDFPAYEADIEQTFVTLGNTLDENDLLFIYVTDHGDRKWVNNQWDYYIELSDPTAPYKEWYDTDFAICLQNISCSEVIIVMQQCHSGGFIPEINGGTSGNVSLQIFTAANENGLSYSEQWLTDNLYDEFTFYWCAAVRGVYPIITEPWNTDYITGEYPFADVPGLGDLWGGNHEGDHDPDLNADGYVTMEEAYDYAKYMDTWVSYGVYYPKVNNTYETPMWDCQFGHVTLQTLTGYAGSNYLNHHFDIGDTYLISGVISIPQLKIANDASLYFSTEDASIETDELITFNNVVINGMNSSNHVRINSSMQLGINNVFNSRGTTWDFYLDSDQMQTSISNATFDKCKLINYGESLSIANSTFNDCDYLLSHSGNVSITSSTFDDTWLYLEDLSQDEYNVSISDCDFASTNGVGIDIWDYDNYSITDNIVDGCFNGIQIMNSGFGHAGNQLISGNTIQNCTTSGIFAYNSNCVIYSNLIQNNQFGVRLLGTGSVALGTPDFVLPGTPIQQISDNSSYEVYSTINIFPRYFKYNKIIDNDNAGNPNDPLVYCSLPSGGQDENKKLDVKYNFWGSNFSASADLYPLDMYWYLPIWNPNSGLGLTAAPDALLQSGLTSFENGDYHSAQTTFTSVVDQYPQSNAAESALKELLRVEKYLDQDYASLQQYYETNSDILADSSLKILGDKLANNCNILLENWVDAISWYENMIEHPYSFNDSIFAIVDLGYTYLLMENREYKSNYTGELSQYKPKSKNSYIAVRDSLLGLLPKDMNNTTQNQAAGINDDKVIMKQNFPNPVSDQTNIEFITLEKSNIAIDLFDNTGVFVESLYNKYTDKGSQVIGYSSKNLSPGIYFYTIYSNGTKICSKKMIVD